MAVKRDEKYYLAIMRGFDIEITPNTQRLAQAGAQRQMNDKEFLDHVRRTPEHAKRYAGGKDKRGKMKMTEGQFQANENAYKSIGNAAGFGVSGDKAKWLAHNNVSTTEFSTRAEAYKQLSTNPALFNAFRQMLGGRGQRLSRKDLFKFVMKQGPREWYEAWNEAAAAYAANQAGIRIGKSQGLLTIRKRLIEGLAKKGYTPEQLASGMEQLTEFMIEDRPMAHALNLGGGLSDKDLVQGAFGGKKSAKILKQIDLVRKTSDAFDQEQVAQQGIYGEGEGQVRAPGGTSKQQRREYS